MTRRAAFLFVLLACGCGGRRGSYPISAGGAPPEAGPDVGSGGATDASADAAADSEAGVSTTCIDWCNTALSVGCTADEMNDCLAACDDSTLQFPLCATEIDAFHTCAAAEPKDHWSCDIDHFATLGASYCAAEQSAMKNCLSTKYPT